ncbi:hypothetical protein [Streptomyces botrytidirepellens]|uniref:Uncharacterized protein n=1 Tax=Streptomyces botrytidirepellens TaxID=2486417 RepID=A0A3M8WF86_9ACTN|nr:hypothetical protein [Streptomyces botrytidirepellens]RNG28768.1 hypothetical protein EEJ42_11475 [Streptomyces botrytidirepellens]
MRLLVTAHIRLVEAVLPGMRERGWGRIVAIGSSGIQEPIAGRGVSEQEVRDASAEVPAGRFGTPDEFAAAVAFLAGAQLGTTSGAFHDSSSYNSARADSKMC